MVKTDTRYLVTGIVLTIILIGAIFAARMLRPAPSAIAFPPARSKGPEIAKIKILEFSDFQCPACKTAQSDLAAILARYPQDVQVVFQHFPIDVHRWSPLAHQAAECAALQNRFWDYHDRLYADQAIWTVAVLPLETFVRYAKSLGLNLDKFAACLKDREAESQILREREAGIGLGVRSTPSFFVNGKLVVGSADLQKEVEKTLEKSADAAAR